MALKATPQNLAYQPVVEFRKDDFDSAIWVKGMDIVIEKAIRCPCEGEDGSPLSSCQNCQGTGYFYVRPIETIGLVTGINRDTKFKEWSAELIGTISLTIRDNYTNTDEKVAFHDRVTFKKKRADQPEVYGYHSEVLRIRDDGEGQKFVFLTYKIQSVIDAFYFNTPTTKLVKAVDYSISPDNPYVLLLNDLTLPTNNVISVRYSHDISYHVVDIPHEVRYSTSLNENGRLDVITFPINVICMRAHLIQVQRPNFDGTGIISNDY